MANVVGPSMINFSKFGFCTTLKYIFLLDVSEGNVFSPVLSPSEKLITETNSNAVDYLPR